MLFFRCEVGWTSSKRTRRLNSADRALPSMCVDIRAARASPLVVASGVSEKGLVVVRTSSITSEGRRAVSEIQNAAFPH